MREKEGHRDPSYGGTAQDSTVPSCICT